MSHSNLADFLQALEPMREEIVQKCSWQLFAWNLKKTLEKHQPGNLLFLDWFITEDTMYEKKGQTAFQFFHSNITYTKVRKVVIEGMACQLPSS